MFVIKNGRKLPKRFDPKSDQGPGTGGSVPADAGSSGSDPSPHDVVDLYHGISVTDLASLMEFGFKPTLGAGSDLLQTHFGALIPGVYMAHDFSTAMTYPMACTTRGKVGGCKDGVQGGTLLAYDGTYPLRAVVRCVAKRGDYLWRKRPAKGNSQYIYMPKSMFITHIFFYAVELEMAHVVHGTIQSYQVSTEMAEQLLTDTRLFQPSCQKCCLVNDHLRFRKDQVSHYRFCGFYGDS